MCLPQVVVCVMAAEWLMCDFSRCRSLSHIAKGLGDNLQSVAIPTELVTRNDVYDSRLFTLEAAHKSTAMQYKL